jgi:Rrf2 family nitric oxide-sensitive transcriptional repressor
MRLTQFSNYAIRVLMFVALRRHRPSALSEMAEAYDVSFDHLKKAAAELCRLGYLETVRGRSGGYRLAVRATAIRIGDVIRQTEGHIPLVECFDAAMNTCPLSQVCVLRRALAEAVEAFYAVLDRYTLADLVSRPAELASALSLPAPPETRVPAP